MHKPKLSLKSKLLITMLSVALLSTLIVGIQGLYYGKVAITERVYEQLTSVRESKEQQIKSYFSDLASHLETLSVDHMTVGAMREFASSYRRLQNAFLSEQQSANLEDYYRATFLPKLRKNIEGEPLLQRYLPHHPAGRYLQHHYLSNNPHPPASKSQLVMAEDLSYYSAVHEHYHPILTTFAESLGYYDIFLIDLESGDIVYSVSKESDYATSLKTGPYSTSNLGKLYRKIRNSQDRGDVQMVDFEFYRPSYNEPAAFAGITVFDEQYQSVGIVAVQISTERINQVMTGGQRWQEQGLGNSGEVFLVGADGTMRSDTRLLMRDGECYRKYTTTSGGVDPVSQKICRMGTSILLQQVNNAATRSAREGQSGERVVTNYANTEVLSAYSPLNLAQLDWSIVAEMSTTEINAPIRTFQRELTISVVLISCLVTLIAMRVANHFTEPLTTLIGKMKQLRAGDVDTRIDLDRNDEYGDLAKAFNQIIKAVKAQQRLINQKKREYSQLLHTALPPSIAKRVEEGDRQVAERVSNVAIIFASLRGFNRHAENLPIDSAVAQLNELIEAFDLVAQKHGVEKVKTIGGSYLAACGLNVQRLDHANRAMGFARDLVAAVQRASAAHDAPLDIRIGITSGTVMAGVVGNKQFAYDVWGSPVNIARQISLATEAHSILITQAVFDRLDAREGLVPLGEPLTTPMGQIALWQWRAWQASAQTEKPTVTGDAKLPGTGHQQP